MSLIRLNDVSIRFENTQILREAFFRLEPGDRMGFMSEWAQAFGLGLKVTNQQFAPRDG